MSTKKVEYTDRDIALIVYKALKSDPLTPKIPPETVKRLSELLEKTDPNRILLERLYQSPIGQDIKRLERHLGSIGGNN